MNTPESGQRILTLKSLESLKRLRSLRRPSDQVLLELGEKLFKRLNLTRGDKPGIGEMFGRNEIFSVSAVHSEEDGLLLVGVTSSKEMGPYSKKAAVDAVVSVKDILDPLYGVGIVIPGWTGRGSVLGFGFGSVYDDEGDWSAVIAKFRPRAIKNFQFDDLFPRKF